MTYIRGLAACNAWWFVQWASCQISKIAGVHAPGMPGTFSPSPQVSDPDMHHGTCVTHVPWCMSGSLTSGFFWNRRRGKTFPAFPAHAQPAILRIWYEAHCQWNLCAYSACWFHWQSYRFFFNHYHYLCYYSVERCCQFLSQSYVTNYSTVYKTVFTLLYNQWGGPPHNFCWPPRWILSKLPPRCYLYPTDG